MLLLSPKNQKVPLIWFIPDKRIEHEVLDQHQPKPIQD